MPSLLKYQDGFLDWFRVVFAVLPSSVCVGSTRVTVASWIVFLWFTGGMVEGEVVGRVCKVMCESRSISNNGSSMSGVTRSVLVDHLLLERPKLYLHLATYVLLRASHHVRIAKDRVGNPRLKATITSGDRIAMTVWLDRCGKRLWNECKNQGKEGGKREKITYTYKKVFLLL